MPSLPGFASHHATRANWQTPKLIPSQARPEPEEVVKQPLGLVAVIGPEAHRLFDEHEIDGIKSAWRIGRRTSSEYWKWLVGYGVKEAFAITFAPRDAKMEVGVTLWIVKRTIQDTKEEVIIATGQDLAFEFAPKWKRERRS